VDAPPVGQRRVEEGARLRSRGHGVYGVAGRAQGPPFDFRLGGGECGARVRAPEVGPGVGATKKGTIWPPPHPKSAVSAVDEQGRIRRYMT
jgi:hypothetical protein